MKDDDLILYPGRDTMKKDRVETETTGDEPPGSAALRAIPGQPESVLPGLALFLIAGGVISLLNFWGGKFAGWTLFGIPQLFLSLLIFSLFRYDPPQKEMKTSPSEEVRVPEKPVELSFKPARVMRVFISSTFRDMQAERDELAKFIFPP